ncbi:unnamed protein product, partial [Polarella glacialis]
MAHVAVAVLLTLVAKEGSVPSLLRAVRLGGGAPHGRSEDDPVELPTRDRQCAAKCTGCVACGRTPGSVIPAANKDWRNEYPFAPPQIWPKAPAPLILTAQAKRPAGPRPETPPPGPRAPPDNVRPMSTMPNLPRPSADPMQEVFTDIVVSRYLGPRRKGLCRVQLRKRNLASSGGVED